VWTQQQSIELVRALEPTIEAHGWNVGLIGGCICKDGPRKDADLVVFTRAFTMSVPNNSYLLDALANKGLKVVNNTGRIVKASYFGKPVDLVFPQLDFGRRI
jgi:hypothetical protein